MCSSAWLLWLLLLSSACSRREVTPSQAPGTAAAGSSAMGSARPPAFGERSDERARLVDGIAERGVSDLAVLRALRTVPRHAFVPESWSEHAYDDRPLPIGHGQTISQPSVVALMTEAARPERSDRCLEIGTGSGYQAAVLAEVCAKVYTIEYLAPLAEQARRALRQSGYGPERIELRTGDGYVGWSEAAPFQVVLVTAAPESVPRPLLDQLAVGGRLVIPVGAKDEVQNLELYRRRAPGRGADSVEKKTLIPVRFVPFLGEGSSP